MFRSTWEASGGVDGRVSLEVSPLLARDTDATLAEAQDIWKAVDRPNLLVKIPATQEGLPAIISALAEGVSINVTLIFSVERYRDVMTAYLEGLERAAANGQNLGSIASVASFFVSRVDSEIDKRLEKIGTDEALALRGKAGDRELPAGLRRVRGGLPGHPVGPAHRAGRQGRSGRCGRRPG